MSSSRREFFILDAEKIAELNEATWERITVNGVKIPKVEWAWKEWVECLGLKLAPMRFVPELETVIGPDGEPELNADGTPKQVPVKDDKGEPKGVHIKPRYRFKSVCKVEGLSDCEGTPIPQGTVYFEMTLQTKNRPLNATNRAKLQKAIKTSKWAVNGDCIRIRDDNQGSSAQHRGTAYCDLVLRGEITPNHVMPVMVMRGCEPVFDATVDAAKKLTGGDLFGQELRERIEEDWLIELGSYGNREVTDPETGEVTEVPKERIPYSDLQAAVEAISSNLAHSAGKYILYRLSGKQHTHSPPQSTNMEELAENALHLCTEVFPQFCEIAALVYSYKQTIPFKETSISDTQLLAAGILYLASKALEETDPETGEVTVTPTPIDTMSLYQEDSYHPGIDPYEAPAINLDVARFYELLQALVAGNAGMGPFGPFIQKRKSETIKRQKNEAKFAQLVLAIQQWDKGEEVDPSICLAERTGPNKVNSKTYPSFGGVDIGPVLKPKKQDA